MNEEKQVQERVVIRETVRDSMASRVVFIITDIIEILLAIRFVLKLLAANPANAFVNLIYNITQPLVAPFLNIFNLPNINSGAIEWGTLIAMLIYGLIGYALSRFLRRF